MEESKIEAVDGKKAPSNAIGYKNYIQTWLGSIKNGVIVKITAWREPL